MCVLLPRCTLCKTKREAAVLTYALEDMTSVTFVNWPQEKVTVGVSEETLWLWTVHLIEPPFPTPAFYGVSYQEFVAVAEITNT